MRKIYFLLFNLCLVGFAYPQCNNSIEIKRATRESMGSANAIIEIKVSTDKNFICVLSVEKGSGPEKLIEKNGSGAGTVRFDKVDANATYQVQFEFLGEEKKFCDKLQKSHITIAE